jgi:hypothetical protein
MRAVCTVSVFAAALLLSLLGSARSASAFDFNGFWATSADQAGKVFARQRPANQVSFTNLSGAYSGGFCASGI